MICTVETDVAGRAARQRGFTLIELMIVVAIIGILASAAIPAFLRYMQKARSVEGIHNLAKITDSATSYYEAHSQFPATSQFGSGWDAWTDDTPFNYWNEYCQNGVFPEAAVKDFNTGWSKPVWNGLLFQPEGNIRFIYYFGASGNKASGVVWGYTYAVRVLSCAGGWKYYAYEYEAKVDAKKNLTFHGPRTWGNVAAP